MSVFQNNHDAYSKNRLEESMFTQRDQCGHTYKFDGKFQ